MTSLQSSLGRYIAFRKRAGFVMNKESLALPGFLEFMRVKGDSRITTRRAIEWATLPADADPFWWASRLTMVRGFARFRSAEDPLTEIPPVRALRHRYHRVPPRILSDEELARLLIAARRLPSLKGLRSATFYTLFGLLAVTGMRPGETRRLNSTDVDLSVGVITIRASKGRTRIVPLHPTAVEMLGAYAAKRRRVLRAARDDAFFVTERGTPMCHATLDWNYGKACDLAQIVRGSDGRPRLHDLRHRFAIRTLESWFRRGEPVDARMEALATYLGHSHPAHTYWYLSATPELLRLAERRARVRS